MKKNNQGFIQIILVLVIIALVGGGMYYFGKVSNKQNIVVETSVKEETAGWKTYSNTEFNFSLRYPTTLSMEINEVKTSNKVQLIFNKLLPNSFTIKASKNYPLNQPKYLLDSSPVGTKSINGHSWDVFNLSNTSSGLQTEEDSVLYSVIYPILEKNDIDEILSTFKFTK